MTSALSLWLVQRRSPDMRRPIKFFLFLCRAWRWKSLVLASPSRSQPIHDLSLAIVLLKEARARLCFFRLFFSHNSPGDSGRLSCAILNRCRISRAKASWNFTLPTVLLVHLCNPLVTALNFRSSVEKGHGPVGTDAHAADTASWNPSSLVQKDSKWNLRRPDLLSWRPSKSGQWSESSEARLWSKQLGNLSSQSTEHKTLSSFTKVGESCWLDQVYLRPCSGISLRARSLMSRLN
jgi:hypothetical protein